MPPKKKGKGGKKKEKVPEISPEEQQRLNTITELKGRKTCLDKDEALKNQYQQERERINFHWVVSKKKSEDIKSGLRNKEREKQDQEERHSVEIKICKQRIKHLLHEHQNETAQRRTELEVQLKQAQDENRVDEADVKVDGNVIKRQLKESEVDYDRHTTDIRLRHDEDVMELRKEYELKNKEAVARHEDKVKSMRDQAEISRRATNQKIEETKNKTIQALMSRHETEFSDIKNYYNDITHNNLDLIKSLKEEVAELKKKETKDERAMFDIAQQNKRMSEPLKRATANVGHLKEKRIEHGAIKKDLRETKTKLMVKEKNAKNLEWENEVLLQQLQKASNKLDELKKSYDESLFEVRQKAGFKNLLLQNKLSALNTALEKKEGQLVEVLTTANLDPAVIGHPRDKALNMIQEKDQRIRTLQAEIDRVERHTEQWVKDAEDEMVEYGTLLMNLVSFK
eukprot:TRINITY_DN2702_c0_g1_i3.p1 TRINITY_DN2702_c0_g1~~TRINITY_DN2702_c0_g1_i3.p1  ORF type:complete len:455 (-),score=166.16 TRINITY_DN2702_c0_g1_i3:292-1656(-)